VTRAVVAVAEEEQVAGRVRGEVAARVAARARLLPRVARQRRAVQRVDGLDHPRAVGAPRREAAPLVAGRLEIAARGAHHGLAVGGEALGQLGEGTTASPARSAPPGATQAPNGRRSVRPPTRAVQPSATRRSEPAAGSAGTAPGGAAATAAATPGSSSTVR
jgi:hypothetical protein